MSAARRRERGAQSAELALWVPLVVLALVALLQVVLVVQAQRAAEQAAASTAGRVGAGLDPADAEADLTRAVEGLRSARVGADGATVVVRPRRVVPWLPLADRSARSTTAPTTTPATTPTPATGEPR